MIWGLCESPITFNAIIGWSNALNEGRMQLREILDLEAMLSARARPPSRSRRPRKAARTAKAKSARRSPAPRSRKRKRSPTSPTPGPTKTTRTWSSGAPRPQAEEEDEDNTLSLAQMEETAEAAGAREIRRDHRALQEILEGPVGAHGRARLGAGVRRVRREEIPEAARAAHRRGRERPVPRQQDRISGRAALQLQPPPDRARRPDAAPRRAPPGAAPGLPRKLHGPRARRELARQRR